MTGKPNRALALVLLLVAITPPSRADPAQQARAGARVPSLELHVRHRRAARILLSVGIAGGFACAAASLAQLERDAAALAAGAGEAAAVRRDVLAFCAGTVLLSFSALAFQALSPEAPATSRE